jgi:hypothetical protein
VSVIPEGVQRFFSSELGIACGLGLGVLVVGWLVVSFMTPGRTRRSVEWIAALGLYVGLLSFFCYHTINAWQGDQTVRLVAFGLLSALFGAGTLITLVLLLKSFAGDEGAKGSATN